MQPLHERGSNSRTPGYKENALSLNYRKHLLLMVGVTHTECKLPYLLWMVRVSNIFLMNVASK